MHQLARRKGRDVLHAYKEHYVSPMARIESYRPRAFGLLRMYLGVGLFARGTLLITHIDHVSALIEKSGHWLSPVILAYAVALSHVVGGVLLAFGRWTRLAALVQIPPVLGAVLFLHLHDGLFTREQSLEFSVLVLFLLCLYALFGAESGSDAESGRDVSASDSR